jgi:hypothetical protein
MTANTPASPRSSPWSFREFPPIVLGFFCAVFLYVCFRIEPAVEYDHFGILFFFGDSFRAQFLDRPGGCLEYAAAFLAQLNHYNWLGALVFTSLAAFLFLSARSFLKRISDYSSVAMPLLITLPLLFFRERFYVCSLLLATGVVVAIGLAAGWTSVRVRLPANQTWLAILLAFALSSLLFYAAGLWPCLLFSIVVALFEGLRGRNPLVAAIYFIPAVAVALGTLLPRGAAPDRLLNPWGVGPPLIAGACAYLLFPLTAALLGLWTRWKGRPAAAPAAPKAKPRGGPKVTLAQPWFLRSSSRTALTIVLLALGWVLVWIGFNIRTKATAKLHHTANQNQWETTLKLAEQIKREDMDAASEMRLHLALYQTGRLCEDLFAYRNQTTWEVLPGLSVGAEGARAQSQVLFRLGLVNDAEHFAHEALEYQGEDPEILRLLAEINILKGRPRAARVFLSALNKIPFQRNWSRACLSALQTNAAWPNEDELSAIRHVMLTNDLPHDSMASEGLLRHLLRSNRHNKMAFEYLLAHYLLTLQLKPVTEMAGGLGELSYTRIPRHMEEAILLYQTMNRIQIDLRGRKIRPETLNRFTRYSEALKNGAATTPEGRQALTRDFGDTYWYYHLARFKPN